MNYADLVRLYFERSNSLQWYWTIYVVVIGGLLAFSSLRQRRDAITGVLVTVLFCFFAYKNLGAIGDVTLQRNATVKLIREYEVISTESGNVAATANAITPTLISQDYAGIRNFHIASDVLTIAAIWAMELRRIRMAKAGRVES